MMTTFSIHTLGCKVNQYESQQVREHLEQSGMRPCAASEQPDLVVVNTCCVTHIASAKSRQQIRKVQKHHPNAVIIVCGCLPVVHTGESIDATKHTHFIKKRGDLAEILSQIAKRPTVFLPEDIRSIALDSPSCPTDIIKSEIHSKIKHKKELCDHQKLPPLTSFVGQTRAFLKIQDGCDGTCTYCIVPQARPFVHSQRPEHVLREAQALVNAGHKEIVLTGIFLGAYGQETVRRKNWPPLLSSGSKTWGQNHHLADLLDQIAQIPNLARIRLSSLEPADVTPYLLDVFCTHRNIMPHLHLSLQSGSNTILKKMCRQYSAEQIRETVELIQSRLDKPAITTDIIVGFPGETEADFEQTVALAEEIGFAKMHVFRFSPRKGTAAAKMPEPVDNGRIKRRSEILHKLDIELGRKFRRQFIGQSAEILIESRNGKPSGRSERYFMVDICPNGRLKPQFQIQNNDLVNIRLVKNSTAGMIGEVLPS